MKCFSCGDDIPDSISLELDETGDSKRGLFRCPHCDTTHVRQVVDHMPDGRPVFHFRIWGHPATTRRRKHPGPGASAPNGESRTAV